MNKILIAIFAFAAFAVLSVSALDCRCTCCMGSGCTPAYVGSYNITSCNECRQVDGQNNCMNAFPASCPNYFPSGGANSNQCGSATGIQFSVILVAFAVFGAILYKH